MRRQAYALALSGLLLLSGPLTLAQRAPSPVPHVQTDPPTASEILARLNEKDQERLAALSHYETDRVYHVDYTGPGGDHQAELAVHATYSAPGTKHLTVVSESGSPFLCDKVLRKLVESEEEATSDENRANMALTEENYLVELTGEDTVTTPAGPERAWVLHVAPRANNKFAYTGTVWVSKADYAIMRIQGELPHSPSWWLGHSTFDYRYIRRGDVWLPDHSTSSSHVRLGGHATLTIDYGDYPVVVATRLKHGVQVASTSRLSPSGTH